MQLSGMKRGIGIYNLLELIGVLKRFTVVVQVNVFVCVFERTVYCTNLYAWSRLSISLPTLATRYADTMLLSDPRRRQHTLHLLCFKVLKKTVYAFLTLMLQ